jgi:beta-galactosidase
MLAGVAAATSDGHWLVRAVPAGARGQTAAGIDGARRRVWINGVHLGKRPYCYSSFTYDITTHLVPGVIVVAVRVDNSLQPNSRWYTGSGIYRHVWLTIVDPLHVGHWGVYITTPRADSTSAEVVVQTHVENDRATVGRTLLRSTVLDASGREVAHADTAISIGGGGSADVEQHIVVPSPQLWSVERPTMYSLRTELLTARPSDRLVSPFGIRTFAYDKDRGFLLNGRRLLRASTASRRWSRWRGST